MNNNRKGSHLLKKKKRTRKTQSTPNNLVIWLLVGNSLLTLWSLQMGRKALKPYAISNTTAFISQVSHSAQAVAQKHRLYSSVMLAQAILESNNGQSQLSQKPYYNFFGIKGNHQGRSVILPTLEDDGHGNLYQIDAAFRSYGDMVAGFKDYADVLQDPLYQQTHKQPMSSYQQATAALTGTYATDTAYGDKLNDLIETYQLTYFDGPMK